MLHDSAVQDHTAYYCILWGPSPACNYTVDNTAVGVKNPIFKTLGMPLHFCLLVAVTASACKFGGLEPAVAMSLASYVLVSPFPPGLAMTSNMLSKISVHLSYTSVNWNRGVLLACKIRPLLPRKHTQVYCKQFSNVHLGQQNTRSVSDNMCGIQPIAQKTVYVCDYRIHCLTTLPSLKVGGEEANHGGWCH